MAISARELNDIEKKALALPVKDRAELAKRLLASLDDSSAQEIETIWAEEAEKRYQAYLQGAVSSRSAKMPPPLARMQC